MVKEPVAALPERRGRWLSGTAPRLYERTVEMVIDLADRGVLTSGTRITESMLAERFGISRTPARRALLELERRGLARRTKGRGYVMLGGGPSPAEDEGRRAAFAAEAPLLSLASWERIYGEVEDEIVARISFGDWRLNEVKLAQSYRVSRTVARDVIGRLQQRGIVCKDDSGRWIAPALSHERVGELYELRAILEPVALRKAAPRLTPAFLDGMLRRLDQRLPDGAEEIGAALDRLEEDLHVTLLRYCGNRALMEAITLPQSLLVAHKFLYRWTSQIFSNASSLEEHREIIREIRGGDVRAAATVLKRHLRRASKRAILRVDRVRQDFVLDDLPYLEGVKSPP